jgi:hypothetical protein
MAFNWTAHDANMVLTVLERADSLRELSGYGSLHLDFRHGTLVSCKMTVRDHPAKVFQILDGDSHSKVGEGQQGD